MLTSFGVLDLIARIIKYCKMAKVLPELEPPCKTLNRGCQFKANLSKSVVVLTIKAAHCLIYVVGYLTVSHVNLYSLPP